MAILGKFEINDVISFDLHVSAIITQDYENVKVKGLIPATACRFFNMDPYATHAQVYRMLPQGTVRDDPESYSYLIVETVDGQERVVGLPWINIDTIKVHTRQTVRYEIEGIAQEDITLIRDVIARYGYNCSFTVV